MCCSETTCRRVPASTPYDERKSLGRSVHNDANFKIEPPISTLTRTVKHQRTFRCLIGKILISLFLISEKLI